jgi:hypothetical protein
VVASFHPKDVAPQLPWLSGFMDPEPSFPCKPGRGTPLAPAAKHRRFRSLEGSLLPRIGTTSSLRSPMPLLGKPSRHRAPTGERP